MRIALILLMISFSTLAAAEPFHVYGISRKTGQLNMVEVKAGNGQLTMKQVRKADLGFKGAAITADPGKPIIYVCSGKGVGGDPAQGATVFLKPDGSVGNIKHTPIWGGYGYIALDETSKWLLGSNYGTGVIGVMAIGEDGVIGEHACEIDQKKKTAHAIGTSNDNGFVYVPYVKDQNAIFQYSFDAKKGKLTELSPLDAGPPEGTGPRHVVFHPKLPVVYFSNEQGIGVTVYDQGEQGQLEVREVVDVMGEERPESGLSASTLIITSDGQFLYSAIRGAKHNLSSVVGYRVDEDGSLTFLGRTAAGDVPWALAVSPDNQYLFASASSDATLTAYKIGEDGTLESVGEIVWDSAVNDMVVR